MNLVNFTARSTVNKILKTEFHGLAEVTDLDLNFKARTIVGQVVLSGETEPIEVHVTDFTVADGMLQVTGARANRKWVDIALKNFVVGRPWKLPEGIGTMLSHFG